MYIHVYHKTWNHETMKPSWNMKPCHSTWIFFLITVWLPSCIFSIFIWNLMARTYHQRFGIHLAMLKKEMGEANWKAACWLVIFLFSWLDCGAGPSRTSSFAGLRCTENGCGAFQGLHCHFFILILVICFWKEEIDWSTVDVWDDVGHLDCSSLLLSFVFR